MTEYEPQPHNPAPRYTPAPPAPDDEADARGLADSALDRNTPDEERTVLLAAAQVYATLALVRVAGDIADRLAEISNALETTAGEDGRIGASGERV